MAVLLIKQISPFSIDNFSELASAMKWTESSASACFSVSAGKPLLRGVSDDPVKSLLETLRMTLLSVWNSKA